MAVSSKQGLAASIAFIIAVAGFLGLSLNTPPESLISHSVYGLSSGFISVRFSVKLADYQKQTPAGPTITVTVQSAQWNPLITHLSITLERTGNYYLFLPWGANRTISFSKVSPFNPLSPGEAVSQEWVLIGGALSGNNTFVLSGITIDGWVFNQTSVIKWS